MHNPAKRGGSRQITNFGKRTFTLLCAAIVCFLSGCFSAPSQVFYHWYSLGPQPINTLDTNNNILEQDIGRVPALAVDPSNSSHWLIGAAQGGVWETPDSGNSWSPRSDDAASLAVGAIAFAPGMPSRVYAGTGEANFRGDDYAGAGLLRSDDGGTHWHMKHQLRAHVLQPRPGESGGCRPAGCRHDPRRRRRGRGIFGLRQRARGPAARRIRFHQQRRRFHTLADRRGHGAGSQSQ